jgi:deoxyribonuclease-4
LEEATRRASLLAINCFQLFTKNNNRWVGREYRDGEVERFRRSVDEVGFTGVFAHTDYLINLASAKDDIREKSKHGFISELTRCERIGIDFLVMHPGSHGGAGIERGISRLAHGLEETLAKVPGVTVLLETTAGQGNGIGQSFSQLAEIIERSGQGDRIGICFDTCHTFAAGYDLRTRERFDAVVDEFDHELGLDRLKVFHLNDSKRELGSRVDRHEHIGWGKLGIEPFKIIMNDARFLDVPKIIETPKDGDFLTFDRINLDVLLGLVE